MLDEWELFCRCAFITLRDMDDHVTHFMRNYNKNILNLWFVILKEFLGVFLTPSKSP